MASSTSTSATLSPKQLVFLFMAATVVAVVVFLCGVLVGRGVPLRQVADGRGAGGSAASIGDVLEPAVLAPISGAPSAAAEAADGLSYYDRLGEDDPVEGPLGVGREAPEASPLAGGLAARAQALDPTSAPAPEPEPQPVATPAAPAAAPRAEARSGEPSPAASPPSAPSTGYAYTVQVAALRAHDAAEQVAGRLIAKGFPAYVLDPTPDAPVAVYRVRVGQYRDHGEAVQIRDRLESEEQFKPWITR